MRTNRWPAVMLKHTKTNAAISVLGEVVGDRTLRAVERQEQGGWAVIFLTPVLYTLFPSASKSRAW